MGRISLGGMQDLLELGRVVLAEARKHYRGRMEAGQDLMRIVIGASIQVEHRAVAR